MLAAVHPVPAADVRLDQAFGSGAGIVRVGRVEGNEVSAIALNNAAPEAQRLQDKLVNMVSRRHAELEVVAGQLQLVDLGAVNGTFVNDHRLEGDSRRVLQENDIVSFGGPSSITIRGQALPNPWVWRVKQLHEFLAAFARPRQGPPPIAPEVPLAAGLPHAADGGAEREVYKFSPSPATGRQQAALVAAQQVATVSPGDSRPGDGQQQDEEVVSPEPALDGSGQAGSIPVRQPLPMPAAAAALAGAAAAQLDDDSAESAELAALAEYEAHAASQHTLALRPLVAHDGTQPLGIPMPLPAAQLPAQQQHTAVAAAALAATGVAHVQTPGMEAHVAAMRATSSRRSHQAVGWAPAGVPQPQPVQPAPPADLIDLTADSTLSQQQHDGGRGPPAAAPEYVDLLGSSSSSPTKRRHHVAQQAEQDAKRAKPSPDACLRLAPGADAAVGAAAGRVIAACTAAAAAAPGVAAEVGPASNVSEQLHQEMVCPICQELLVMAHAMVPCGHWFCGECLVGWLGNGRKDCPSCRMKSTTAPLRQHAMDNMAELLAKGLTADDLEARRDKLQSWEENKAQLEKQLAAPWQRGASRSHHGRPADGGLLSAIAASILGGGGGLGFGAPGLLLGGGSGELDMGMGMEVPPWGGGGTRARRMPAVVPRHAPSAPAPHQHEFRAEVSPARSTQPCSTCGQTIRELTTRIGMRPLALSRRGQGGWRWHHLHCLPAPHWREARLLGIANLRGIPAPEQSLVRQHLQLAPQ